MFYINQNYTVDMKKIILTLTAISFALLNSGCSSGKFTSKAEKNAWKLSMQSYTFHLFSAAEALEKTQQLGLKYIEIYPGQKMGHDFSDAVFGYNLSNDNQEKLKKLAASKGVKIVSSGVWTASREEWEKIFSFARNMDMEFISAEPAREDWDVVESLAREYGIKVATHNHPNENSYWKPEILLDYIGQRDALLGSSADVGHFKRMNVEPISALKELQDRLISLHFKDIAPQENNNTFEDVVWGTGVLDVKSMLQELKRQKFKGYFTIEYEANWENNLPEIRQSIDYFNEIVNEIL